LQTYIALLRGINVGGTGLLPMTELVELCTALKFEGVRTYIQSGNVLLQSALSEDKVRSALEKSLEARMGKKISVMVRTAGEMKEVLAANPFPDREANKTGVAFLCDAPPHDLAERTVAPAGELVHPGKREIYIYYPIGMGQSRLKLPLKGAAATIRNINTVAKLVALSAG
jgi:uncharacterized protein (DUF1697 family)